MAQLSAKDHLGSVIGLKNDIVHAVFTCPCCRTEVTVSRWQVAGELAILCARCNSRYQVRGEDLLDLNAPMEYFPERWEDGKPRAQGTGYKVLVGLDATQKATAPPKDSYLLVVHPELAPKPAPPAAAPRPAPAVPGGSPASGAPAAPSAPPAA